jgi:competence ComEA-like helix-hairpin-helix protein
MDRGKQRVWLSLSSFLQSASPALPCPGRLRSHRSSPSTATPPTHELQQVPGIGSVTAAKILQMRKSFGAFKSVYDLLSIRGIGKKTLGENVQIPDGE